MHFTRQNKFKKENYLICSEADKIKLGFLNNLFVVHTTINEICCDNKIFVNRIDCKIRNKSIFRNHS